MSAYKTCIGQRPSLARAQVANMAKSLAPTVVIQDLKSKMFPAL